MASPIPLKVCGRLQGVTLSMLGNASIDHAEAAEVGSQFCLHPDYFDQEIVEAEPKALYAAFDPVYSPPECDDIQEMHRRFAASIGRGSWPPGKNCHPTLYPHDDSHATTISIDVASFLRNKTVNREVRDEEWQQVVVEARVWPSIVKPVASVDDCKRLWSYDSQDPRVLAFERPEWKQRSSRKAGQPYTLFDMGTWLFFEAARRAGCFLIEKFDGKANILERMVPIPGSTAGFAYFPDGTCGDVVTSNIDSLGDYGLGWFAGLRTHENGHNLGLQHEFSSPQTAHRSVMSYATDNEPFQGYRRAGAPYQYQEDRSWPELRAKFGGDAAKPILVAPPTPPPPVSSAIPGDMRGRRLSDGTYAVDGIVGPIPADAVGKRYIVQRIGKTPVHRLIPKAEV